MKVRSVGHRLKQLEKFLTQVRAPLALAIAAVTVLRKKGLVTDAELEEALTELQSAE